MQSTKAYQNRTKILSSENKSNQLMSRTGYRWTIHKKVVHDWCYDRCSGSLFTVSDTDWFVDRLNTSHHLNINIDPARATRFEQLSGRNDKQGRTFKYWSRIPKQWCVFGIVQCDIIWIRMFRFWSITQSKSFSDGAMATASVPYDRVLNIT